MDVDGSFTGYQAKLLIGGEQLAGRGPKDARCNPNNVQNPEKTEYLAGNLLIQESSKERGEAVMWCVGLLGVWGGVGRR